MSVVRSWLRQNKQVPIPPESDALDGMADGFAAQITLNSEALLDALRSMTADAWTVGLKDAAEQTGQPVAEIADVDWSAWKPGHPKAADLLAGPGFDELLADANVSLRQIDDITRKRVGHVLADGVREGASAQTIASGITDILHDADRASLIAVTEVNRAMTVATHRVYADNGVPEWNLLTAPGACPVCVAVEAANPHPLSDLTDQPPLHPRCRCALAPHL